MNKKRECLDKRFSKYIRRKCFYKRHFLSLTGFTIFELIVVIALLALVLGSISGAFMVVQRYFKDGIALAKSQATARVVIEEMVRPIRHGSRFEILSEGNGLKVVMTGTAEDEFGSEVTFTFDNGDGIDTTFEDNKILMNDNIIGKNIIKIPGENIFQQLEADERVGVNFGVRNKGLVGFYKEVHICTEMKLRN